jgi:hypothetical protein
MIRLFSRSKSKKAKSVKKSKRPKNGGEVSPAPVTPTALAAPHVTDPEKRPPTRKREMTPERERLIRQALLVHAHQTKMLDELDDDVREKLRALAAEKLLGEIDRKS